MPKFSSTASANTTLEWPREKKNPTESGRLPSLTSLRVVLSHAEGVGQRPGAHPEHRRLADVVVAAQRGRQHHPAQHVQPDDRRDHAAEAGPLRRAQAAADLRQAGARIGHRSTFLQDVTSAQFRSNCNSVAITYKMHLPGCAGSAAAR